MLSYLSHDRLFVTPQATRLFCSWDSPGKNTRVGCHFLFQILPKCMTIFVTDTTEKDEDKTKIYPTGEEEII